MKTVEKKMETNVSPSPSLRKQAKSSTNRCLHQLWNRELFSISDLTSREAFKATSEYRNLIFILRGQI